MYLGDNMEIVKLIVLAIVQGITEPLPISSSGHVILFEEILGLELPGFGFELFINFGSLLGIVVFFWKDLLNIVKHLTDKKTIHYIVRVPIAALPAGIIGFFFAEFFEVFKSSSIIAIFLIVTGLILFVPKWLQGEKEEVTVLDSLVVGLAQIFALIPGVSRSGTTTVAGMARGVKKEEALFFSFLVFIPLSFASGVYSIYTMDNITWDYGLYFVIAAVMTYLGLLLFKNVLLKNKLHYFSYYCFVLAILIFVF